MGVEELHKREGELMQREVPLAVREQKARVSKKALA
jgi:hypothetical protein